MATAKYGDKVQVHYTGTLDNGKIFVSSKGSEHIIHSPMEFVIGQEEELLPRFQEAIIGLEPGESVKVRIAAEDACGPRLEELVFVAQRSEIYPEDELLYNWRWPNGKMLTSFRPTKGDMMAITLPEGNPAQAIVTEVTDATITFDANHPLAGKDLTYDITLVDILGK
jgi:peptidylprolyl isomerase